MLSLADVAGILWVAGGIIITLALLVGLAFWIAEERPIPGPPQPGLPPAEPEQQGPHEQPPEQDRPALGRRED